MMLDFHQKRKVRSLIYNRVTLVVLFSMLMIVIHSTWVVYTKKVESQQMRDISQKNVDALKTRSIELQDKIDKLSTKQGVEEEVRSKFSVVKDNENMVIIVQDQSSTSQSTPKKGFFSKIAGFFTRTH